MVMIVGISGEKTISNDLFSTSSAFLCWLLKCTQFASLLSQPDLEWFSKLWRYSELPRRYMHLLLTILLVIFNINLLETSVPPHWPQRICSPLVKTAPPATFAPQSSQLRHSVWNVLPSPCHGASQKLSGPVQKQMEIFLISPQCCKTQKYHWTQNKLNQISISSTKSLSKELETINNFWPNQLFTCSSPLTPRRMIPSPAARLLFYSGCYVLMSCFLVVINIFVVVVLIFIWGQSPTCHQKTAHRAGGAGGRLC